MCERSKYRVMAHRSSNYKLGLPHVVDDLILVFFNGEKSLC
jgi:hypothetical protein